LLIPFARVRTMHNADHQPTVGFIGAGRVGAALAQALVAQGVAARAIFSRNSAAAQQAAAQLPQAQAAHAAQEVVDACDLVFITVSDDAIAPVCSSLQWRNGQSAVHCSGATEVSALAHAAQQGAHTGGFHPLMAFADPHTALLSLPGCTVAIEAQDPLAATLHDFARRLGCTPLTLPPGARALYHASAHYAGAFFNAWLADAVQMWQQFGATEAQALAALAPLARSTLNNALASGLTQSLPGVVSRGDVGTLQKHLHALEAMPAQVQALYRTLALRNVPAALARGSIDAQQAAGLLRLLQVKA
jgi:predicted short-subunit dehydrogenase-like oxidoreductase (DUF2520 family)